MTRDDEMLRQLGVLAQRSRELAASTSALDVAVTKLADTTRTAVEALNERVLELEMRLNVVCGLVGVPPTCEEGAHAWSTPMAGGRHICLQCGRLKPKEKTGDVD